MSGFITKLNIHLKSLFLVLRIHIFLGFLAGPFRFISNLLYLSKWISENGKSLLLNDFFSFKRDHRKREKLYQTILEFYQLDSQRILYLEFGVYQGASFNWWLSSNRHQDSSFYGFDTFEGLPEDWGIYEKGTFATQVPNTTDPRGHFVKGLFQDTLPDFIKQNSLQWNGKKIIHLDADLFSSTIFALSLLSPYLVKGDIILFDEFNVPNHEFAAFKIFNESFHIKTRLVAAVNNYYQIALEVV